MYHAGLPDTPEVRKQIRNQSIESSILLQLMKEKKTLEEISRGKFDFTLKKQPGLEELTARIKYLIERGSVRETPEGKYSLP